MSLGFAACWAMITLFKTIDLAKHGRADPDNYVWVCTISSVKGEFVTIKPTVPKGANVITLHRFTKDGERRDFMFPVQKLEGCNLRKNGENSD